MTLCFNAGHIYFSFLLIALSLKCYQELIDIPRNIEKDSKNPFGVVIDIWLPLAFVFNLLPKTLLRRILIDNDSLIDFKTQWPVFYSIFFIHHSLMCGFMLILMLVVFTLSLRKG